MARVRWKKVRSRQAKARVAASRHRLPRLSRRPCLQLTRLQRRGRRLGWWLGMSLRILLELLIILTATTAAGVGGQHPTIPTGTSGAGGPPLRHRLPRLSRRPCLQQTRLQRRGRRLGWWLGMSLRILLELLIILTATTAAGVGGQHPTIPTGTSGAGAPPLRPGGLEGALLSGPTLRRLRILPPGK